MSVIASTDIYNLNDEVLFDKRTLEKLQEVDIEDLDYEESEENDENIYAGGDIVISKKARAREALKIRKEDEGNEDMDSDVDHDEKRINKMADDIDAFYESKKEYQGEKDRKIAKKEKKKRNLIE